MTIQLINPSVELVEQETGREGIFRMIERAAKVTTQTSKPSDDPEEWVRKNLIEKGHMRPLEFGTVYIVAPARTWGVKELAYNPYTRFNIYMGCYYITTNYRVIIENNLEKMMDDYMSLNNEPLYHHPYRPCLFWNIGRDVADEFRTHTAISSMMESTRYCKYTAGKYDGIAIADTCLGNDELHDELRKAYEQAAKYYERLIERGASNDLARKVLPLSVRTHMMQCGFFDDWKSFLKQRAFAMTGTPHPDAQDIALKAADLLNISIYDL